MFSEKESVNPMPERLFLLLLFLLALLLRLYGVERESLWFDEIFQVVAAQNSWWQTILTSGGHLGSAPLDYLVTHFTLYIGQSEGILRLAPVLWGSLAVLLTYQIGKTVFDRPVGVTAAFMLMFTPKHIYYSREVRFYSLTVLLALVVMWCFQWALQQSNNKWRWLLYGMVLCLGLYCHYYMAVIAGMQGIWLLIKVWREPDTPRRTFWVFLMVAGGAMLLFSPWIIYDNVILGSNVSQYSLPLNYLFSEIFSRTLLSLSHRQVAWLLVAGAGMAGLFFIGRGQRLKSEPSQNSLLFSSLKSEPNQYALLFLSTTVVGIIGAVVLDYLAGYFFSDRQLLIYTPFLLLFIAYGGLQIFRGLRSRLPTRLSTWLPDGLAVSVMAGLMLFSLGSSLDMVYAGEQHKDWRSLSRYLLQYVEENDVIVTPCVNCIRFYSPELADQITGAGHTFNADVYERVWFMNEAHLPEDVQATVDTSILENQSPTYHFTLYLVDLPGD